MRLAVPVALAGLSLLLLGGIAYETFAPLDPVVVEVPPLPKHIAPAVPAHLYIPPPESDFADIDARPLFSAARKPLADSVQAAGAPSASSDLALIGVIMDADRAVALIHSKSTNTTASASLGDPVNGWHVVKIEPAAVTLRANGTDTVVGLDGPAVSAPSAPLAHAPAPLPPPPVAPAPASASAPLQTAPTANAATPVLAQPGPAKPGPTTVATAPTPKAGHATIAPDALKGATFDPTTGEPTL
jgi:hypothetical protein